MSTLKEIRAQEEEIKNRHSTVRLGVSEAHARFDKAEQDLGDERDALVARARKKCVHACDKIMKKASDHIYSIRDVAGKQLVKLQAELAADVAFFEEDTKAIEADQKHLAKLKEDAEEEKP